MLDACCLELGARDPWRLWLEAWRLQLVAIIQAPLIMEFFYEFGFSVSDT